MIKLIPANVVLKGQYPAIVTQQQAQRILLQLSSVEVGLTFSKQSVLLNANSDPVLLKVSPQTVQLQVQQNAILFTVLPGGGGASDNWQVDTFTPTLGQTSFVLSRAKPNAASLQMCVNSAVPINGLAYTVGGNVVTLIGLGYQLDPSDTVQFQYSWSNS